MRSSASSWNSAARPDAVTLHHGEVRFSPPEAWRHVAAPPRASSGLVDREAWDEWVAPDGGAHAVKACFGGDLGVWSEEATPLILGPLEGAARAAAAERDATLELHAVRDDGPNVRGERLLDALGKTVGRTVVGFAATGERESRMRGCFLLCAPTSPGCEAAISEAVAIGFDPPPPAGLVLRGVELGIQHSRWVAGASGALLALAFATAIATRPRSRRK